MVAIVTGPTHGLLRTSASVLGANGQVGSASLGRASEQVYVNAASGNLTITRQDEFLVGLGPDISIGRTYNSQRPGDSENGDGWRASVHRKIAFVSGTYGAAGSKVQRLDWDASDTIYTWDATENAYIGTQGAGAYDRLTRTGSIWTWTDGDSQLTELYDDTKSGMITRSTDTDGNSVAYTYNGAGQINRVAVLNAAGQEVERVDCVWDGLKLTQLVTTKADGTLTRVRYAYETYGANNALTRLISVEVDLSPGDNSVVDGQKYTLTYTYADTTSIRVASIAESDGSLLQIGYTANGAEYRVTSLTETASSGVTRITGILYDLANRSTRITDPLGGTTTMSYDTAGNLTNLTTAASTTSYTYNANGDVTSMTENGRRTDYEYDIRGNQTLSRDAAGNTVVRTYGLKNQLLTSTAYLVPDPDGAGALTAGTPVTTRYAYDGENHLRFTISAEGKVTEYRYDRFGQRVSVIEYRNASYNLTGLAPADGISEAALNSWVSAMADRSNVERTDTFYDFRGNITSEARYASVSVFGEGSSSPLAITPGANATVTQQPDGLFRITKTSGAHGYWDSDAHSTLKSEGDFVLRLRPAQTGNDVIGGVATAPGNSASYQNLQYGFYFNSAGTVSYMENGSWTALATPAYGANESFWLTRVGNTFSYYRGATLAAAMAAGALRTQTASIGAVYFDSSLAHAGTSLDAEFTPQAIVVGANTSVALQPDGMTRITKTGGSGWDAYAGGTTRADGDFVVHAKAVSTDNWVIAGVSRNPAVVNSVDYSFYFSPGNQLWAIEGEGYALLGSYKAGEDFWLTRVGDTINYYRGATLETAVAAGTLRTVGGVTGSFYFDSAILVTGGAADVDFTPLPIVNGVNTSVSQQADGMLRVTRNGATSWDADARSTTRAAGDFVLKLRPGQTDKYVLGGVSNSPAANASYETVNYSVYFVPGSAVYYLENGSGVPLATNYAAGDTFWLVRTGSTINYYKGATLEAAKAAGSLRTCTGVAGTFSFDSAFYSAGAVLDVSFDATVEVSRTNYIYSPSGQLLSRTTAGSTARETFVYDGLGRLVSATDLANATTTFLFNDAASTTTATLAGGVTRVAAYNKAGELISITETAAGLPTAVTNYFYDGLGRLRMETNPSGLATYHVYDSTSRKVADVAYDGAITEYVYDADNRLVKTVGYINKLSAAQIALLDDFTAGGGGGGGMGGIGTLTGPVSLLTNGGFETSGSYTATEWGRINPALTGWTKIAGEGYEQVNTGYAGVNATEGVYWLDLDSSPGTTLIPVGSNYLVNGSFDSSSGGYTATGFGRSDPALPGWVKAGGAVYEQVTSGFAGIYSTDGPYWLDLDSTPSTTWVATGSSLLTNGSFDTSGSFTTLATGRSNTDLPGWTKANSETFEQVASGQMGVTAAQGGYWLDMESVAGPLAPVGANLIVNGSFEQSSANYTVFTPGDGYHEGYQVILNNVPFPGWQTLNYPWIEQNPSGLGGVVASDGNHWLDLEGDSTSSVTQQYFYQTITGLTAGQTYQLKFDHANRATDPGETFKVRWNGTLIATVAATGVTMLTETFQVTAKSGNNELMFESVGINNQKGPALDNVRLYAMQPQGGGGNMDISQTVTGRTAGEVLKLQFNHANRATAASGSFEVWWNNALVATVTDTGTTMIEKTYDLIAVAGSNTLRFKSLGTVDVVGASIDNVRLFATVPGPAGGNMDISQTVSVGTAGTMQLQFDHANRTSPENGSFDVYWNGGLVAQISSGGTAMLTKTYQVSAVAGNNTLRFVGTGPADGTGASLDNVRLFAMGIDPNASNMHISQTVGGLAAGQSMLLQFDHANRVSAASGAFEVYWNDQLVATVAESGVAMQTKSYNVTAIGGSNTLRFKSTGTGDSSGASLDNVRLFVAPGSDALAGLRPGAHGDDRYEWNVYDSASRLIETIDGSGAVTAFAYDGASRRVSTTALANRLAAATVTAYKGSGPTTMVLPASDAANDRVARSFYDKDGLLIGTLDGEGYLTENVYDSADLLIETIRYATATAAANRASGSFATLKAGVAAPVNAKDIHSWYLYDARGLLRATVDGEGDLTRYQYTARGDVASVVRGQKLNPAALIAARPTLASIAAAPGGQVAEITSYTYNAAGKMLSESRLLSDGGISTTTYAYDSLGRLTSRTEAAGTADARTLTQRYDARGNLIGQLGGEGSAALAALGANPAAAAVDNVYATWGTVSTYDARDRLITRREANGVNAAGNRTVYFYRNDDLAFEVNALGDILEYRYNSRRELADTIRYANRVAAATLAGLVGGEVTPDIQAGANSFASSADSVSHIDYDVAGRVRQSVDAVANAILFDYNAFGELKTRTDPIDSATSVQTDRVYDRRGLLVSEKRDPAGLQLETIYAYDAFGRPSQVTDPAGRVRKTDYDRAGRVVLTTDARNATQSYSYDGRGNVLSITDRNNATTTFTYDAFSRTTTSTTPGLITTTIKHDAHGQTISIKDGALRETLYAYDKDGHLKSQTDAVSQVQHSYDSAGRHKETIDARGSKTSYTYDAANRVLTEKVNDGGLNLVTAYEYDPKGQKFKITDPANRVTLVEFDKAGRKTAVVVDGAGFALRTQYDYDKSGRLLSVTEAAGTAAARITQYEYDKADRLLRSRVDPNGLNLLTQYSYDKAGNVARKTDAAGFITTYAYDAENRLTRTLDAEGGVVETFYDNEGRVAGTRAYANAGSAAAAAGGAFTISVAPDNGRDQVSAHVYDSDGRLRVSVDGAGRPTEYVYDTAGNVVRSIVYAGTIAYAVGDGLALVQSRTAALASLADNRITRAVYDGANRQAYGIDATGQVTAFGYDGGGNVVKRVRYANLLTATHDSSLTEMQSWAANYAQAGDRVDRSFYDGAGRATFSVDAENYVTQFQYDAAGRVTKQIRHAGKTYSTGDGTTEAGLAGQIGAPQASAAVTSFAYDSAGRLTDTTSPENSVTHLVLDALGQAVDTIVAYNVPADTSTIHRVFDKAGRVYTETRAYGTAEASTTLYEYDGMGRTRFVTDGRTIRREIVYDGAGRVIREVQPLSAGVNATTYKEYDKLGNLAKVTDPRGNIGYFYYDALNRLTLQVDPQGYATKTTYTIGDEPASVTRYATAVAGAGTAAPPTLTASAADATTTFTRDKLDRLKAVTDAENFTESYTLNAFGDRISVTNKLLGTTVNTFDKRGLLLSETLPVGSINAAGTPLATNIVNTFEYDARGNRTKTVEAYLLPEQRTTVFGYDKADRMISKTGDSVYNYYSFIPAAGNWVVPVETYKYDARGNVIETVAASGARTLSYYDDQDRKSAELNALGTLSTWSYDANGNVVAARIYESAVALPQYAGGTAPAPVNPTYYRETTYTYDLNDRLFETQVAGLRTGEYGAGYAQAVGTVILQNHYDAAGNLVREVDGRGNSVYTFYDRAGRRVARVDQERYLTSYTLDGEGNVVTEERFSTRVASVDSSSDPAGLRASVLGGAGNRTTTFTYDRNGRRKSETRIGVDARSLSAAGVLQQASGNAQILYDYNGLGQVTRKTEANLDATEFSYDAMGRQTSVQTASYYDFQDISVRRRTETVHNGLGLVTRSVDKAKAGVADRVTTYTYGAGGRLDQLADAAGTLFTHRHDTAGNLVLQTFQRADSAGVSTTYANAFCYDLLGRATSQSVLTWLPSNAWSEGDRTQYRYNAYGDVTGKGVNVVGDSYQERFDYDSGGRLWRSNSGDGVWRFFVYDGAGNRTLTIESEGADLQNYSIESAIAAASHPQGLGAGFVDGVNATFAQYDKRGQQTATHLPFRQLKVGQTQTVSSSRTYNAFGEVASETDGRGFTTDFFYNAMGRMTEKRSPEVAYTSAAGATGLARPTEKYYYDIAGRMIGYRDANSVQASASDDNYNATTRALLAGTGHGGGEALVTAEFHADDGVFRTAYDGFGDARMLTDERGKTEHREYDALGRLTKQIHRGSLLTDFFQYDALGQRIKHWNDFFGTGNVETTDYDIAGRVTRQVTFGNVATNYSYAWNGAISTAGLGTFGGWAKSTSNATGSSTESLDLFGRTVARTDQSQRAYGFSYDAAGRLVTQSGPEGQSQAHYYYNTNRIFQITDTAGTGNSITASFGYDEAGNRTVESYTGTVTAFFYHPSYGHQSGYQALQNALISYDALGRVTAFTNRDGGDNPTHTFTNQYDLVGNIRRATSSYLNIAYPQHANYTTDQWFLYDSMNRMTLANGSLVNGVVERGTFGTAITYDEAGRRRTATTKASMPGYVWIWVPYQDPNGPPTAPMPIGEGPGNWEWRQVNYMGDRREDYIYRDDGYLMDVTFADEGYEDLGDENHNVAGNGVLATPELRAFNLRDAMGRVTQYTEYNADGVLTYNRHSIAYDPRSMITSEGLYQKKLENGVEHTYTTSTQNYYYGPGGALSQTNSQTAHSWPSNYQNVNTSTNYYYGLWDDARVTSTTHDDGLGANWSSTYRYDGLGRLASVDINDGRRRTVSFASTPTGQILSRIERSTATANPQDYYYFLDGRQVGELTSNGNYDPTRVNYSNSFVTRNWTPNPLSAPFRWNTQGGVTAGQFGGSGYDPISPSSNGMQSTDSRITTREGDTLAGIAAQVWGDSSLWYMLAEANGLTGAETLAAGTSLIVPSKVTNLHNNSKTFEVYDPNRALGDLSPTAAKPPKKANKCGLLGTILIIAVAVAVTLIIKAPVTGFITGLLQGGAVATSAAAMTAAAAGAVLGAAATGAIASVVSQGFGIVTGLQDKFSWKGVAMSALSAGISAGVGGGPLIQGAGKVVNDVARGALVNAATQGVAVATGLQKKFDWAGVAVAGVVSGVTGALSRALPDSAQPEVRGADGSLVSKAVAASQGNQLVSSLGGAFAGAATRSILTGTSFGDNLMAVLPDVIGTTIGNMIGEAFNQQVARKQTANRSEEKSEASAKNSPADAIVVTSGGDRPYNILTDGIRLDPFEISISPELRALMEFASQREQLMNLASVEGGDALRSMIAKSSPRQLQALRDALVGPQGSRAAGSGQDTGHGSAESSAVTRTDPIGPIPAGEVSMDAILAGSINEYAFFTDGGQERLAEWLYHKHQGLGSYFDGSDASIAGMVDLLSGQTRNNDFRLDGNIVALRRTGDPGLIRVAQGLEAERQKRWENGGAQRAAMADAAAFDIVKYGFLLPMSIGAAPVLVVEGVAVAGAGTAFSALRGAMFMTAGTEMGTRGIGEYFGGTRGIISTTLNGLTGTGGGNNWGVGDVVTTTAEAWTLGEGAVQLTRYGLSRLSSWRSAGAESVPARVTVYRVEGTPNARFAIDDLGNVALEPGNKTIWLNFGQEGRGLSYLDRKVADGLPGASLKSFDVEARFLDEIRATAVPERLARRNPGAPITSRDPFPDQYGLRPDQFQKLIESVYQGTGKNVRPR